MIVIDKPKILEIKAKIALPVSATAGAVKNLQNATSSPGLFPQKMGGARSPVAPGGAPPIFRGKSAGDEVVALDDETR